MTKTIRSLEQHPISRLFPAMTEEEYHFTREDIRQHGQKDPILLYEGKVLDGWHRFRICRELGIEPRFTNLRKGAQPLAEVISRNLARRQLTPAQRYGVLLRIADEYPEVRAGIDAVKEEARQRERAGRPLHQQTAGSRSSTLIGQLCGVSSATVERVDRLRRLSPARFEDVVEGKETLLHALNRAAAEARRDKQAALGPKPGLETQTRLLCGDFRKVLATQQVPPITLAFADLPWDRKSLPLWNDVGRVAARVLRDGGVLAAYPPKPDLPQVMVMLGEHLRYHWCLAVQHVEPTPLPKLKIISRWQPVLLLVRGPFKPPLTMIDLLDAEGKERDRHRWQRPVEEFEYFIRHLTKPGDWVLDVAGGSFASGKAAQRLGRNYLGIDIDQEAVAKGKRWIEEQ